MADPLAAARPDRDVLLATKLHVPALQAGLVLRPRLAGRLHEGLAQGLILVCAPAGYGKTVLLAESLTLACPPGYLRVFADEGRPMAALLGRLIAAQRARRAAAEVRPVVNDGSELPATMCRK